MKTVTILLVVYDVALALTEHVPLALEGTSKGVFSLISEVTVKMPLVQSNVVVTVTEPAVGELDDVTLTELVVLAVRIALLSGLMMINWLLPP